ncbi:MAG: DNA/RNA nuclease SfsA [Clostridiales bacterium]|nr:DNA/RNA nuclease SfsA [Clostridiales bacterium]
MKLYHDLTQCSFLCRVNRFIAKCSVGGVETTVHVKNTGRLKELLVPGATCWLEKSANPGRKTLYDLVAVEKDSRIVNIDSQAPNLIAKEWVETGGWGEVTDIRSEVTWGDSRFDLGCMQGDARCLIEVKGVTLFNEDGVAIFPDAPTTRGAKHLHGLIEARRAGMESGLLFVIMKEDAVGLAPNDVTDPDFSAALREAHESDVRIVAACCRVTADAAEIVRTVPLIL